MKQLEDDARVHAQRLDAETKQRLRWKDRFGEESETVAGLNKEL